MALTNTIDVEKSASRFRHIRLHLAREPGHPEGDASSGYDLLAPLTADGHLDPSAWKSDPAACRVRRYRSGEEDEIGHLARKPGGQWCFRYEHDKDGEESGFRFGNERFIPGEYLSLIEANGTIHTFKIVSVEPI